MNIIKPELQWMGNKRCYRVVAIAEKDTQTQNIQTTSEYIEAGSLHCIILSIIITNTMKLVI